MTSQPVDPDQIMPRTIAFRRYINGTAGHDEKRTKALEMAGFLELFHPDMDEETKRALISDVQNP